MLQALAECDAAHPLAREAAQATLAHTESLRGMRDDRLAQYIATTRGGGGGGGRGGVVPPPPSSILPSYMLENLARAQDAHPEARQAAQRTLVQDEHIRQGRADSAKLRQQQQQQQKQQQLPTPKKPAPRHLNRLVYDCEHLPKIPGTLVRSENEEPTTDASVNECYDDFGHTFNFYYAVFNRNSIDDAGLNLLGNVHYGVRYNNAFWDGREMVFGDGDGVYFNGFTGSVDIIGHELSHGVVEHTCALAYRDQSGALNESVSDIFGSLVKQHSLGQTAAEADWLIGAGIFTPAVEGVALRSMKDPGTAYDDPVLGKDPQPKHFKDFVVTQRDQGGVHINSGIPNHAFYLLAIELGGHAWERAGKIWYETLKDERLTHTAEFELFAQLTLDNALSLYGKDVADAVKDAWNAVGINSER